MKKKLFAAVLSAAVLASTGGFATVSAAEMKTVKIEGEENCVYDDAEYMAHSAESNGLLSGGKYGNIRTNSGTEFKSEKAVFSYSFTVESDGYYELSFTASKYNNTNYSAYAIAVDDGAFVTVDQNTTVKKTADIGTDNVFATYKLNDSYMLLSGKHTLKFKMLDTGTRGDKRGYVFLDCAVFTETGSIPGLKVSGSDQSVIGNSIVKLYTEKAGSTDYPVFKTDNGIECPEEGVIVTYTFTAPEEGLYNLTVSANQYDGGLSTYAVAVNDGDDFTTIDASSVTEGTQVEGVIYTYKTALNYELKKGINTVSFKILTGSKNANNRVYCFLNYLEFSKVEVTPAEAVIDYFETFDGETDKAAAATFTVTPEKIGGIVTPITSVSVTINEQTQEKSTSEIPEISSGAVKFGILIGKSIEQSDIKISINNVQVN